MSDKTEDTQRIEMEAEERSKDIPLRYARLVKLSYIEGATTQLKELASLREQLEVYKQGEQAKTIVKLKEQLQQKEQDNRELKDLIKWFIPIGKWYYGQTHDLQVKEKNELAINLSA